MSSKLSYVHELQVVSGQSWLCCVVLCRSIGPLFKHYMFYYMEVDDGI